jgi:uncharacterized protein (DUF849 family)
MKADFPRLPVSSPEITATAEQCLEAGAAMLHLHVRDEAGRHTLAPEYYNPVLEALSNRVEGDMLIQVTSESAGIFDRHQQMEAMRSLSAESMSVAVRELVPDETAYEEAARFFEDMTAQSVMLQYILYSPEEVDRYHELIELGVIPQKRNFVLFVLGSYGKTESPVSLRSYVNRNTSNSPWMCCAFGAQELSVMSEAALLNGHARVGFENNMTLPSGSDAASNSQLVALTAQQAKASGRHLANASWVRRLGIKLRDQQAAETAV